MALSGVRAVLAARKTISRRPEQRAASNWLVHRRGPLGRPGVGRFVCVVLLPFVAVGAEAGRAAPAPAAASPSRVAVTLVDFRIRMSRRVVAPGRIVFIVVNKGAVAHDLVFVKGGRTRVLRPGGKQTIAVTFSKSGVYRFFCGVPGHRALGMQGTLRVGSAKAPAPKPPPASSGGGTTTHTPGGGLQLVAVGNGLAPLTDVAAPPGDASRLMIVPQA